MRLTRFDIGNSVLNFLLVSSSVGDFRWWSMGVALYDSSARKGSPPSLLHFVDVSFTAFRGAICLWIVQGACDVLYTKGFCEIFKFLGAVLWSVVCN